MLKLKLNKEYKIIESNEEGLKELKLGLFTKYLYFHRERNAGFLINIIYPKLSYLKDDILLVFKNNNNIIYIPFYKYKFKQLIKKSYFSIKDRDEILNNKKNLLNKINKIN